MKGFIRDKDMNENEFSHTNQDVAAETDIHFRYPGYF